MGGGSKRLNEGAFANANVGVDSWESEESIVAKCARSDGPRRRRGWKRKDASPLTKQFTRQQCLTCATHAQSVPSRDAI